MTRSVPDTHIWFASIQWHGKPRRIRVLAERRLIALITSQAILAVHYPTWRDIRQDRVDASIKRQMITRRTTPLVTE